MKYIIQDETRRINAIEYLKSMDITKPVEVHIKPYKKNRTKSQNDTLWMWYEPLADYTGYTSEELHERMKVRFLGVDEYEVGWVTLCKPKSTTKLSTKEMAEFMLKVEELALELGVKLKYPDDYRYATYRE